MKVNDLVQGLDKQSRGNRPWILFSHCNSTGPKLILYSFSLITRLSEFSLIIPRSIELKQNINVTTQQVGSLRPIRLRQKPCSKKCSSYSVGLINNQVLPSFITRDGHRKCEPKKKSEQSKNS